jgi:hypothetical protein
LLKWQYHLFRHISSTLKYNKCVFNPSIDIRQRTSEIPSNMYIFKSTQMYSSHPSHWYVFCCCPIELGIRPNVYFSSVPLIRFLLLPHWVGNPPQCILLIRLIDTFFVVAPLSWESAPMYTSHPSHWYVFCCCPIELGIRPNVNLRNVCMYKNLKNIS